MEDVQFPLLCTIKNEIKPYDHFCICVKLELTKLDFAANANFKVNLDDDLNFATFLKMQPTCAVF